MASSPGNQSANARYTPILDACAHTTSAHDLLAARCQYLGAGKGRQSSIAIVCNDSGWPKNCLYRGMKAKSSTLRSDLAQLAVRARRDDAAKGLNA